MSEQSLYHNYNWDMRISVLQNLRAVVRAELPAIACPPVYVPNQTARYPLMGDLIEFDPMVMSIILDEKWNNYIDILNWFYALRSPKMLSTHKDDRSGKANILLSIRGNQGGPNRRVILYDVKPTNLSAISFNSQVDETEPTIFDLTVVYSYFEFLEDGALAEGFGVSLSST